MVWNTIHYTVYCHVSIKSYFSRFNKLDVNIYFLKGNEVAQFLLSNTYVYLTERNKFSNEKINTKCYRNFCIVLVSLLSAPLGWKICILITWYFVESFISTPPTPPFFCHSQSSQNMYFYSSWVSFISHISVRIQFPSYFFRSFYSLWNPCVDAWMLLQLLSKWWIMAFTFLSGNKNIWNRIRHEQDVNWTMKKVRWRKGRDFYMSFRRKIEEECWC